MGLNDLLKMMVIGCLSENHCSISRGVDRF